jgi:hypothetical protein
MIERKDDRSIADLLAELSRETSQLVKQEVELATTELTGKARLAGTHVGVAAAGGALAHAGLLGFLAALVLGLSELGITPWLSALIISVLTAGVGYLFVNKGLAGLRSTSVAPTRAMESLKEDARWTRKQGA